MKRIIGITLLLISTFAMADNTEPACVQKPVDTRSTTVKVFNGITQVVRALDPTIWIARGILMMVPGQHHVQTPNYCEDVEPQVKPEDQPATTDSPFSPESQGTAS